MILTIHRGTHEIGGSCVEIRTDKGKTLIDLGMPLDYDKHSAEEQEQMRRDVAGWCKDVDAVFLSHAHTDHYGFFNLLANNTPIYASEETFTMLALDGIFGVNQVDRLERCTMQAYVPYEICGLTVTGFPVDHSAFGACALLFESDDKRVLYSGDIRLHGVKGVLYKRLPQNVDYLLLEGTNVSRSHSIPSERDIEEQFVAAFADAPQALHMVWCSSKNIDRICTIFRACLRCGKQLVVDPYVGNVLAEVAKLNPKIPSVTTAEQMKVYYPPYFSTALAERKGKKYLISLNPDINKVTYDDFAATPERYVMIVRSSLLDFMQRLQVKHIRFIKSIWGGYWGDKSVARFRNWVEANCEVLADIHSSGHADAESLRRIVEHVQPKHIVPIHTERPEKFSSIFPLVSVNYLNDNECLVL